VFRDIANPLTFTVKKVMWNLKAFEEVYTRYQSSGLLLLFSPDIIQKKQTTPANWFIPME
jgi:hypothetical protein